MEGPTTITGDAGGRVRRRCFLSWSCSTFLLVSCCITSSSPFLLLSNVPSWTTLSSTQATTTTTTTPCWGCSFPHQSRRKHDITQHQYDGNDRVISYYSSSLVLFCSSQQQQCEDDNDTIDKVQEEEEEKRIDERNPARKNSSSTLTSSLSSIHLNHAGASPSPSHVTQRIIQHLQLEQELGGYTAANVVQKELEQVYYNIGKLLGLESSSYSSTTSSSSSSSSSLSSVVDEIALMESATVAWTRIFYTLAQTQLNNNNNNNSNKKKKNVILISEVEYAANVVAICQWARDYNWTVLAIPSSTITISMTSTTSMTPLSSNTKQQYDDSNDNDNQKNPAVAPTTSTSTVLNTGQVDLNKLKEMLQGNYTYRNEHGILKTLNPKRIAMICITHIPTNSGIVNPIEDIGTIIATYNNNEKQQQQDQQDKEQDQQIQKDDSTSSLPSIFYLVDACQSVGQRIVHVPTIQCHALVGTGRKYLRGPRGTGFLYVNSSIVHQLQPHHIDHYGVPIQQQQQDDYYYRKDHTIQNRLQFKPRFGAKRFEFWESSIANRLGLGMAIQHCISTIGLTTIQSQCIQNANYLCQQLLKQQQQQQILQGRIHIHHYYYHYNDDVQQHKEEDDDEEHDNEKISSTTSTTFNPSITSNTHWKSGIVTFWIDEASSSSSSSSVAAAVDGTVAVVSSSVIQRELQHLFGVQVSVVPATSTPLDSSSTLRPSQVLPDLARASVSYTTTKEEIDAFCKALVSVLTRLHYSKNS